MITLAWTVIVTTFLLLLVFISLISYNPEKCSAFFDDEYMHWWEGGAITLLVISFIFGVPLIIYIIFTLLGWALRTVGWLP
jgi:hypothetical protein